MNRLKKIKFLTTIIFVFLFKTFCFSQSLDLKLTKGEWDFCVIDTLKLPYKCDKRISTFKFKKSGRYIEKNISMIINGKTISKLKGTWKLNGNKLELIPPSFDLVKFYPKSIEIVFLDKNTFYSSQQDYKIVIWLCTRVQ
ncbi:MAG: hypothetical protein V4622_13155 [Bacteroidota bacterium]